MPPGLPNRLKLAARILIKGDFNPSSQRENIPDISPEEIAQIKQFFPMEKFFIYGHARSGTTLLARLVRLHPEVHCNWQGHFFTRQPFLQSLVKNTEVGIWLSRRSNRWNQGKDLSPMILRGACDLILEREAHQVGKCIVGDKSPNSLVDAEAVRLMHKVYPDAHLVYIVRDGRDAILSHRFQTFIDADKHLSEEDLSIRDAFIRNPESFLIGKRSIFTRRGIRRAAEGWVRNVLETDQAGRKIFVERYLSLRFEDLLKEPWKEISRIWSFLGASVAGPELENSVQQELKQNPDADWQQQKASQIALLPLQKGKSGSWRVMFTSQDRLIFNEIAGETLHDWGYPTD